MALRTVIYRTKAGPGAIQRAVVDEAALPAAVTGLTNGVEIEVDVGDGTWISGTPQASGVTWTLLAEGSSITVGSAGTVFSLPVDVSGAAEGDELQIEIAWRFNSNDNDFSAMSLGGVPLGAPIVVRPAATGRRNRVGIWRIARPAGPSPMNLVLTVSGTGSTFRTAFRVLKVTGRTADVDTAEGSTSLTIDTVAGGGLYLCVIQGEGTAPVPPGGDLVAVGTSVLTFGSPPVYSYARKVEDTTAQTGRVISTPIGSGSDGISAIALSVS